MIIDIHRNPHFFNGTKNICCYSGQLVIRAGVEIGMERHRLAQCESFLKRYPFDFVIGSSANLLYYHNAERCQVRIGGRLDRRRGICMLPVDLTGREGEDSA